MIFYSSIKLSSTKELLDHLMGWRFLQQQNSFRCAFITADLLQP